MGRGQAARIRRPFHSFDPRHPRTVRADRSRAQRLLRRLPVRLGAIRAVAAVTEAASARREGMKRVLVLLAVAAVSAVAASGTQAKASALPTLTVRSSSYGKILFDGRGFVLYAFTRDPRGGKSRCYGDCASSWPVYYKKGPLVAGKGVRQKLIGTVKRK